ncbi:MAG: MMPL family transporter [Planctomycetes bacterium]|nr:MMPL family transporter [Planctomycetota bacterium]MCP4839829.1 MMPL family transporter [Planctomycetota bacterium]
MHRRLRDRLLRKWGRFVTTHPAWTLWVCSLLAAVSVLLAVTSLEIKADRNDLLSEDLPWTRLYAEYREDFPRWDDIIICLEGETGDSAVDHTARRLAEHLRTLPEIHAANAGFANASTGPRLWKVAPTEVFQDTLTKLNRGRSVAAAATAADALLTMLQGESDSTEVDAAALTNMLRPYIDSLEGNPVHFGLLDPLREGWTPLVTASGRIRLIMVSLARPAEDSIAGLANSLDAVRSDVSQWLQREQLDETSWGITGIPAIESDETEQATKDSTIASIVAFLLVTAMLIGVFRRIRLPLMAATSLLIGIAWSFAWVVISIGHLQLLSMVFSAILIGLGVDFALHIVARLRIIEKDCKTLPDAMARTFQDVGPGLVTGAITTAAAFGCTAFSAFLGVAEMGIIAAGGVLLCLFAIMSAFPAMLTLSARWRNDLAVMRPVGAGILRRLVRPLHRHAKLMLTIAAIATLALVALSSRLQYDSNIMNLQPPHLEAVAWQRKLAAEPGADLWSGLVMTSPQRAPELVSSLRTLDQVEDVGGMGMLFPPDLAARQADIAAVLKTPAAPKSAPTNLGFVPTVLSTLRDRLRGEAPTHPDLIPLVESLDHAVKSWHALDRNIPERTARIDRLNSQWAQERPEAASYIAQALDAANPAPSDLPPLLQSSFVGRDGQWLLRVAPVTGDISILEPERLDAFVTAVRRVAPDILGPPVQVLESSRLIVRAYATSGGLALVAVLALLVFDFRSLADACCAILPVIVGFAGTFGLMGLIGLHLNFANLMVLPMIFGIGVDSGIHVVHRWLSNPNVRPPGLWGGTGTGILLTTTTTVIGFASLMLAEHRGIQSLAIVMVIGLLISLAASWTVLPAVLRIRTQRHRRPSAS